MEKKKKYSNGKWAIAFLCELIIIVVLAMAIIRVYIKNKMALVNHADNFVTRTNNEELVKHQKGYTNIALFGLDARDQTSASLEVGTRSDTIIIVSINNSTGDIKMVSVYRDTLLKMADYDDFTTKINAAYAYGGPEMAVNTLNENLDLDIHEFVSINWTGLIKAIDAIGGIEIEIKEKELDKLNEYIANVIETTGVYSDGVFSAGKQTINGVQATAYARIRSTDLGDITRTERQREIISAMMKKMKKAEWSKVNKAIDAALPFVYTSIDEDDMYDLAKKILKYNMDGNKGFPFRYAFYDSDSKGSCIAAYDLSENVVALHKYLFGVDNYTPSSHVQKLNEMISDETGTYGGGSIDPYEE
ncbi:transcriptional attenuator, LytR family [Eubacterium ruminantium]|nr:transcriptional attenuator, LytR family [Eubacterium ruminantium]